MIVKKNIKINNVNHHSKTSSLILKGAELTILNGFILKYLAS